jgi:hypothetical protein
VALKIIGAGFGRTGTLSLKGALEELGFDACYHMLEVVTHPQHVEPWRQARAGIEPNWDELFEGYQAAVDWPACSSWRELRAHYPQAKVILSLRDADSWYESVMNTIYPTSTAQLNSEDPAHKAFGQWAIDVVWQPVFDGRVEDRSHAIEVFERHNASVIREVPTDQLLVFQAKDGWAPLCRFLEVDVPETPYPRTNTTEQFQQHSPA